MIRLLSQADDGSLLFTEFTDSGDAPAYAVLSHLWSKRAGADELLFEDVKTGGDSNKSGLRKVLFCLRQARRDGLSYVWVDTCCIDKSNSHELGFAINSMYQWYKNSTKCYVYMSDVSQEPTSLLQTQEQGWITSFRCSEWFARGWTLQELLAPTKVIFFSAEEARLGDKTSLQGDIIKRTNIPIRALQGAPLDDFTVEERFSWITSRKTTIPEDRAYCMLGIFDVSMPLLYGEGQGEERAFRRLRHEIKKLHQPVPTSPARATTPDSNERCELPLAKRRKLETPSESERMKNLIDSLKFKRIEARHRSIKHAHPKTCKWLVTSNEYLSWINPDKHKEHNGFLWIKGKAGSGKSTMMKYAVEVTRKKFKREIQLSFFFNARGDALEKSVAGAYRTLLVQLLPHITTVEPIFAALGTMESNFDTDHEWEVETLKKMLFEAFIHLDRRNVVCFIDALDECDETDIREMIALLSAVCEETVVASKRVHICLASRYYPQITIEKGLILELDKKLGHEQDIVGYLRSALHVGNGEDAERIRSRVLSKASGVFMWVVIVVDMLNKEFDIGSMDILERLNEIPNTIHELFHDILTRDSRNKGKLLLCIQWVLFAREPLSPLQLLLAIRSENQKELESRSQHEGNLPNEESVQKAILDVSKGLTEITMSTDSQPTVQFIHESVRDFLLKRDGLREIWPDMSANLQGRGHSQLLNCCQQYTAFVQSAEPEFMCRMEPRMWTKRSVFEDTRRQCEYVIANFPLLEYAVKNLLYHADRAQEGGVSQEEFLQNFDLDSWLGLANVVQRHVSRLYSPDASLLYILADRGLSNLIKVYQYKSEQYMEVCDGCHGTPLFAALAAGESQAAFALLERRASREGADIRLSELLDKYKLDKSWRGNFRRKFICSNKDFVIQAFKHGNQTLLNFLDLDDQPPSSDPQYMILAVQHGFLGIVQRHLLEGFSVEQRNMSGHSLLNTAIVGRQPKVVELLLEYNADPDERTKWGLPLIEASKIPSTEIVRSLLEAKATVDRFWRGTTALHSAARHGHIEVVKLLLDAGASVDIFDNESGRSALHYAAIHGHIQVMKLLLDAGASADTLDIGYSRSAFHYAAMHGHTQVVKLLLDAGASDQSLNEESSALRYAAEYGHTQVVQLLLNAFAFVYLPKTEFGSIALRYAASNGHTQIVQLLLNAFASVDLPNTEFGSAALRSAASKGYTQIVQLLLDAGAFVDLPSTRLGFPALHLAANNGHTQIVQLLLDAGASVSLLPAELRRTVLRHAAAREND